MNDYPLISVVVPVYNTKVYLRDCIQSLLYQTYKKIEVILIDDGSSDGSSELCDEFERIDSRIRVIHQTNKGLSSARNNAVAVALGAFLTFVDSDDWVVPHYIQALNEVRLKFKSQIVIGGIQAGCGKPATQMPPQIAKAPFAISKLDAIRAMLYQKEFDVSACGVLYPLDLLKINLFPDGKAFEDLSTTYRILYCVETIAVIPERLYFYRKRIDSITHTVNEQAYIDELAAADEMAHFIQENCPTVVHAARAKKMSCYFQVLLALPRKEQYCGLRKRIWDYIISCRCSVIFDSKARLKNRLAALISFGGETSLRVVWNLIKGLKR